METISFESKLKKHLYESECMSVCAYMCFCAHVFVLLENFLATEYGLIYYDTGWGPDRLFVQFYSQWEVGLGILVLMKSGVRWISFSAFVKDIEIFLGSRMLNVGEGLEVEIKRKRNCYPRDKNALRMVLLSWGILCLAKSTFLRTSILLKLSFL